MSIGLFVEPEAEQELEEAALWYEEQRHGLGSRLLAAVSATLERLQRFPEAGAPVPFVASNVPARRVAVNGFPYFIVYLVVPQGLHVLAFAHQSRQPSYWLSRT